MSPISDLIVGNAQARKNLANMLFRGASSMLRRQDPSAIEQRVDLSNLACELNRCNSCSLIASGFADMSIRVFDAVVTASVELSMETQTL